MKYYEKQLEQLSNLKLALEGKITYSKSIISIMNTIKISFGMSDAFNAFDPVAIDNIIKVHECYITAYENKINDIDKQIRDFEDKSTNGSKSSEIIDALFSCLDELDVTDYV